MQKKSWLVILLFFLSLSASAQKVKYAVEGDTLIHFPGFLVPLTPMGFPQQVTSTSIVSDTAAAKVLLAENIHFHLVRQSDGKDIRLKASGTVFTTRGPDSLKWKASGESPEIRMEVNASMDASRIITYQVRIIALEDIDMKDIVMHIPFDKGTAKYLSGLGFDGHYNPDTIFHYKRPAPTVENNGAWIGDTTIGLSYSLVTFYIWDNFGKGGIDIGNKGKSMLVNNYTGARHLQKGDSVSFDFFLGIRAFPKGLINTSIDH